MGTAKYKELGITYRLEGIPAATKDLAAKSDKNRGGRHQGLSTPLVESHQNTTSIIIKFEDNYLP